MPTVTRFVEMWCPFTKAGSGGVNRDTDGQPLDRCRCMGESCAAWRWFRADTKQGYCGAFGEPSPTIQRKPK